MKNPQKWLVSLLLFCVLLGAVPASASTGYDWDSVTGNICAYMYGQSQNPVFLPFSGNEWTAFELARANYPATKEYYDHLYQSISDYVTGNSNITASVYAKAAIAVTAMGRDAADVNGVNILSKLASYTPTMKSDAMSAAYAVLALDANPTYQIRYAAARERLVGFIVSSNGMMGVGWHWDNAETVPDLFTTAVVLLALAPYQATNTTVKTVVDNAVEWLSDEQLTDSGGYIGDENWNPYFNCETTANVLTALSTLGINAATDDRFIKNGHTVLDALMSFYNENGYFTYEYCYDVGITTDQALQALLSYQRLKTGKTALYDMTDVQYSVSLKQNESGSAVLTIYSFLDRTQPLLLGAYKNGKMTKIQITNIPVTAGLHEYTVDYSALASEDAVSAFFWEGLGTLKPSAPKISLK